MIKNVISSLLQNKKFQLLCNIRTKRKLNSNIIDYTLFLMNYTCNSEAELMSNSRMTNSNSRNRDSEKNSLNKINPDAAPTIFNSYEGDPISRQLFETQASRPERFNSSTGNSRTGLNPGNGVKVEAIRSLVCKISSQSYTRVHPCIILIFLLRQIRWVLF